MGGINDYFPTHLGTPHESLRCTKDPKLTLKPFFHGILKTRTVWAFNRENKTIHVSITNGRGGSGDTFALCPHWSQRNGDTNLWQM